MESLKKGSRVNNPTTMKKGQLLTNAATALAGMVCLAVKHFWPQLEVFGIDVFLYQDGLTTLFLTAFGLINYYFTVASTRKVGIVG